MKNLIQKKVKHIFCLKAALGLAMLILNWKLYTEKVEYIFCLKAALGLVILFARPPFVSQDPGSQAAMAGLHWKCNLYVISQFDCVDFCHISPQFRRIMMFRRPIGEEITSENTRKSFLVITATSFSITYYWQRTCF